MAAPPKNWLVDEDGKFNPNIEQVLNLASENCPIAAVSIIGAQNTGKSTLLNKCFSTKFQVRDESQAIWSQITKGILIAKGSSLNGGPKILLIDIEGSDSSKRAQEGDDSFERKSAAFALAISNTVIVNMDCKGAGHHNGGSWSLLKTVFQVMLLGKFKGKVTLMFVLRDKDPGLSPDNLKTQLTDRLIKIWQGISRKAKLEDYFEVEVMTMSHYVYRREEFDKEVKGVRNRLSSLVKEGQTCPASEFLNRAKRNWDDIMKNETLKLNLTKAMDKFHCEAIIEEEKQNFLADQEWRETETAVGEYASKNGTKVEGFGKRVNSIIDKSLSQYDKNTLPYDESTRNGCRDELKKKLSSDVKQSYLDLVKKMREETLDKFAKEIAKGLARGDKLANINSAKFFDEFKDHRLEDAHVELATWNHAETDSQLKEMQSKLDDYIEGARNIIEWLKTQEQNKVTMLVNFMTALGFGAALVAAPLMAPVAAAGIVVVALGVAVPLPPIFVVSIFQALIQCVKKKKHIEKERKARPEVDKIMTALESIEEQKNKGREDRPEVDKIMTTLESIKIQENKDRK